MNKLFEMFDRYIDEKILAKTNQLEGLQIRDSNRIADLERGEDFEYRISELECTIEDKADANATEQTIENAMSGIEDMLKDYVDTALVGADLGEIDSCEVERLVRCVIDDIDYCKVERIVRCVLDEIKFKVTMER